MSEDIKKSAEAAADEVKAKASRARKKVEEVADDVKAKVNEAVKGDEDGEPTAFESFLDHQQKAFEEAGKAFVAMIPPEVREHGSTAVKEMFEGYKKLFNAVMDEVSTAVDEVSSAVEKVDPRGKKVEVTIEDSETEEEKS